MRRKRDSNLFNADSYTSCFLSLMQLFDLVHQMKISTHPFLEWKEYSIVYVISMYDKVGFLSLV